MMPENDNPLSPGKHVSSRSLWRRPGFYVAVIAIALAGAADLDMRRQMSELKQAFAARQNDDRTAQTALNALREEMAALQTKVGELEELNESLQSGYQELSHGSEEASLLEVEQAVTLAAQQLQLAGNVRVAVLALQGADARLARVDWPQYLPLRKALAKDIERLNALSVVDVPGISLRLEQLIGGIDKLPLAAYGRPPAKAEKSPASGELPAWKRIAGELWQELRGLVRIQRFDSEEAPLLAPGQDFFLRENLKLRLLNARLAVLSHDQWTFRNELKIAEEWLGRYFVADDKVVLADQAALHQLQASEINVELPGLRDSQAALRTLHNVKEKR